VRHCDERTKDLHERNIEMKTYRKYIAALVIGALLGFTTLGCNTFKGAGKDIQKGGQKVENAAEGADK
jgi:predicted small secreted protein